MNDELLRCVSAGFRFDVRKSCALVCDFTWRRMVNPYRRFGTTYRSHIEGSNRPRRDRQFVPNRRYGINILRHVKSQKSADLELVSIWKEVVVA